MSQEKIKKMFDDLSAEEQNVLLSDLSKSKKKLHVDLSDVTAFASRHQKEYKKDITFTVRKDNLGFIEVVLHTVFGNFKGVGTNQKIAKKHAVILANETWND